MEQAGLNLPYHGITRFSLSQPWLHHLQHGAGPFVSAASFQCPVALNQPSQVESMHSAIETSVPCFHDG
jgi:hypothetical protein